MPSKCAHVASCGACRKQRTCLHAALSSQPILACCRSRAVHGLWKALMLTDGHHAIFPGLLLLQNPASAAAEALRHAVCGIRACGFLPLWPEAPAHAAWRGGARRAGRKWSTALFALQTASRAVWCYKSGCSLLARTNSPPHHKQLNIDSRVHASCAVYCNFVGESRLELRPWLFFHRCVDWSMFLSVQT